MLPWTFVYALVVLAGLAVAFWSPPVPDARFAIPSAEFIPLGDFAAAVPASRAGTLVKMPHNCAPARSAIGCAALYRMTFRYDPASGERWSVYVPTFAARVEIRVNGVFLADSLHSESGAVIRQAGTLLAVVPASLLRAGENRLDVRLGTWSQIGAFLDRIYVGPEAALRQAHAVRKIIVSTLPMLLMAWQAALSVSLLIVWIGRREERMYLVMSAILALGVMQGLPQVLIQLGWPSWQLRAANLAGMWQLALLPGLMARLVGRPPILRLRWALAVPATMTAAYFAMLIDPPALQAGLAILWTLVAAPAVLGLLLLSMWIVAEAAIRRGHVAARAVFGGFLIVMPVAAHDLLVFFGMLPDQRIYFGALIGAILMTVVSATLMWRFAAALNEVSRFNEVLRQEVVAAEAALRASFAREQAQIRATALESERVRLTRDLHDGLAGQLVSMVAQCELAGREDYRQIGLSARRALDDLRLVLASLDEVGDDLAMTLALFRERIGPQLQAQGMELQWQMAPLPDIEGLRSEHTLGLFRLLQEAVTNAARHSGERQVAISMAPAPAGLGDRAVRIVVADRGRGGLAERPGGRGLGNMRRRAAAMGAHLAIETGSGGTRVIVDLPRAFPDIAGAEGRG